MSRKLAVLLLTLAPFAFATHAPAQDKVLVQDTPAPPVSPLTPETNSAWGEAKKPVDAPLPETQMLVQEPVEVEVEVIDPHFPMSSMPHSAPCMTSPCMTSPCASSPCRGCGTGGCCCAPCAPPWAHRSRISGEYLFIAPRGLDVDYAAASVASTSNPSNLGIPAGGVASTDLEYDSGYRVGFGYALSECASVQGAYTFFNTEMQDSVTAAPGTVLRSLITQPLTEPTAVDWQSATARQDVEFRFADLELRWLVHSGRCHAWNLTAGARYAEYEENFQADFAGPGTRTIATEVHFEGGGLRLGLDFERYAAQTGFFAYGKGFANFLAGSFENQFIQNGTLTPGAVAEWEDERVITVLEVELGLGWQSPAGHLRATAGYLVNGWFNMATTNTWIDAVQTNSFDGRDETITFDGLAGRIEYRF